MWGPRAALASATTQAAINLARQRGMRFGYCEFAGMPRFYHQRPPNHVREEEMGEDNPNASSSTPIVDAFLDWGTEMTYQFGNMLGLEMSKEQNNASSTGHFFGVDYNLCKRRARQLDTNGFTNLQEMLRQLLVKFSVSGLPPHERHLLIITDGSPTIGSTTCTDEAMLARSLGVSIHPIFVVDESQDPSDVVENFYPKVLNYLADETNGVRFLARHEVTVDEAELENNGYAHLLRVKVEVA